MGQILDDELLSKVLIDRAEEAVWFFKMIGTDPDRATELLANFKVSIPPDDWPYFQKGLNLFYGMMT